MGGEQQLQTKDVKWSATETGSKLDSGWTPVESPEPSPREVLIAAGSELNMRCVGETAIFIQLTGAQGPEETQY